MLDALRSFCGYVENGTDQSIKIFQDDATKYWFINRPRHGQSSLGIGAGASFREAIETGITEYLAPDERPAIIPAPDFRQRIAIETDQLETRLQALKLFMMTDTYKAMERVPQDMLAVQSRYMHGYLSALQARVGYYEDIA